MPFLPLRRWFQFRLSTWFVLVAIIAWAMTCRPYYWEIFGSTIEPASIGFNDADPYHLNEPSREHRKKFNPSLRWPALALTAFLTWKAAWAVGPRLIRRHRSAAPE
jgi:hypothetical protein